MTPPFSPSSSYRRPVYALPSPNNIPFPGNLVRGCTACELHKMCRAPVPADGPIPAAVMLLGEAPGQFEDEQNKPFVGRSGQQLDSCLQQAGITRSSVYISNVCHCRPPNNSTPKPHQIAACAHWLDTEIDICDPKIIVAMGATAISRLLGPDAGTVEHLHGKPVTAKIGAYERLVLPCYHPAAALHNTALLRHVYDDFQVLRGLLNGMDPSDFLAFDEYPNPEYRVADTPGLLKKVMDEAREVGQFAIDVETINRDTEMWSAQISSVPGTAWFIPCKGIGGKMDLVRWKSHVIVHHYLADVRWLSIPDNNFTDTMTQAYILGQVQGLKELASRLLGVKMQSYTDLVRPGQRKLSIQYLTEAASREWPDPPDVEEVKWDNKAGKIVTKQKHPWHIARKIKKILADTVDSLGTDPYERWNGIEEQERACIEKSLGLMPEASLMDIPFEEAVAYSARDAQVTLRVKLKMDRLIEEAGLEFVLHSIDLAALPMVQDMMANGMCLNMPYLKELSVYYGVGMEQAASRAALKVGHPFNPSSSKQVATVVYEELGFQPTKLTATKLICTDDQELKKIPHPVIADILDFRRLNKNKGTYADGLSEIAVLHGNRQYRLHTTILTTRTATGRVSSKLPNLQNIPTRSDEGKKIRKSIIATPGYRLLASDFSQQELRLQAHEAKCKNMIDLFLRNIDIHTATAARIFGVSMEEAEKTRYRYPAKTLNFSIIYLITAEGLCESIHEQAVDIIVDGKPLDVSSWTVASCQKLIDDWYKLNPEVRDWQMERVAQGRRYGYVTDIFNRRRYTPEVASPFRDIQEAGSRLLVNHPIQSGCAGITKLAMAAAWKSRNKYYSPEKIRFLMAIHDELMLEIKVEGEDDPFILEAASWIKGIMDNVIMLAIPMVSEAKAGPTWADMKKLKL